MNTTGVTSGAGTAYPSGAPEFTPMFSGFRVTRSLVLYVCFVDRYLSFCPFSLTIVSSVRLRFMDSDYPFGIFKLSLVFRMVIFVCLFVFLCFILFCFCFCLFLGGRGWVFTLLFRQLSVFPNYLLVCKAIHRNHEKFTCSYPAFFHVNVNWVLLCQCDVLCDLSIRWYDVISSFLLFHTLII
jgi:hypothetical protein